MNNPNLYLTLVALLIKIFVGYRLYKNVNIPNTWLCMVFLLIAYVLSALEFYGYYALTQPDIVHNPFLLKIYYTVFIAFLLVLPNLYLNIIYQRCYPSALIISAILLIASHILLSHTDLIISGAIKSRFAFTAVKGEYYWTFRLYAFCLLFTTFSILIGSYLYANNAIRKAKSANLLIGYIPLFILLPIVIILMAFGIKATASGIIGLTLSIILLILAKNLNSTLVIDLRAFIPGSKKFKMLIMAIRPILYCTTDSKCRHYDQYYDLCLTELAEEQFEQVQNKAKWLGVSKPTYYRKKLQLKRFKPLKSRDLKILRSKK